MNDPFAAKSHRSVIRSIAPNSAIRSDASVLPDARHKTGVFGCDACDRFTTRAHQCEQRFDAMNTIEEHVGSPFLVGARSPNGCAGHATEFSVVQNLLEAGTEPERRTGKTGNIPFLREVVDHN